MAIPAAQSNLCLKRGTKAHHRAVGTSASLLLLHPPCARHSMAEDEAVRMADVSLPVSAAWSAHGASQTPHAGKTSPQTPESSRRVLAGAG